MNKPFKFRAEHFGYAHDFSKRVSIDLEEAADIANAKLQEWLAQAPIIYGVECNDKGILRAFWGSSAEEYHQEPTHKARLVCIEEIVQESPERKLLRKIVEAHYAYVNDAELIGEAMKLLGEE